MMARRIVTSEEQKPYAYIRWVCSECDSEPIERRTDTYDLVCEQCGNTYRITRQDRAEYVPDPDDVDEGKKEARDEYERNERDTDL